MKSSLDDRTRLQLVVRRSSEVNWVYLLKSGAWSGKKQIYEESNG